MITLCLRFIPSIKKQEERITKAISVRGIDFSGSILSELQQFADNNELILALEQSEQVSEDTGLIGNTYVVDNNAGIFLNSGDTLNAKVVKYVKEASEVLPEDPEKNPDANPDTNKDDKPEG